MKKRAKELEFISWINRDGTGVQMIDENHDKMIKHIIDRDEEFELFCLSMTNKTYIARNFNSFVVKIKES